MSLARKVFAAPARLWMNWPLWGGLLAMLLLAKHTWVLFAPAEHAVPGATTSAQSAQAEQLFGSVNTAIVELPYTVGGDDAAKDLYGLFDDSIARLLAGLNSRPSPQ